jgi:hypothetical protein
LGKPDNNITVNGRYIEHGVSHRVHRMIASRESEKSGTSEFSV